MYCPAILGSHRPSFNLGVIDFISHGGSVGHSVHGVYTFMCMPGYHLTITQSSLGITAAAPGESIISRILQLQASESARDFPIRSYLVRDVDCKFFHPPFDMSISADVFSAFVAADTVLLMFSSVLAPSLLSGLDIGES